MIPILYEKDEQYFTTNGLGRLRDCISCVVTEERNGIYECDFEYPVTGQNYKEIRVGRIIGVTHDDRDDIQPFDIVSFTKPIDGIVSFHCTHISYRQSFMTVRGKNISILSQVLTWLKNNATPTNPFTYTTDITSNAYFPAADGIPRSVRQMLGGIEGSILDTYGGEYEWDKFNVILHSARGELKSFTIRYGVNMLTYDDDLDISETFTSVIPYWTNDEQTVVASKVDSGIPTPGDHEECVPLDLSDKFENKPNTTALRNEAANYLSSHKPYLPTQTIKVSFANLSDFGGYSGVINLEHCRLCDQIRVIFPDYGTNDYFKIVKVTWDVLADKYEEMELGALSTSLSEALGLSVSPSGGEGMQTEQQELTLTSQFDLYSADDANSKPIVRKFGNVCSFSAILTPTSAIAGSTTNVTITTLPEGFRPSQMVRQICQGSGNAQWLLTVTTDGTISFARYHTTASGANAYASCAAGNWLPIHATWIM